MTRGLTDGGTSQSWYALQVKSNFEQTTSTYLRSIGYQTFSPTYEEQREGYDRMRQVDVPLFRGYVFCHFDIHHRLPVLKAPGVVNVVGFGKEFVSIPDEEIEKVRLIAASPVIARPCSYLNVGEVVQLTRGPLTGLKGILVEVKNQHRLIVSVDLLQRSVAAEVNVEWVVKPLRPNRAA